MNIAIENNLSQMYRSNPTKQKEPVSATKGVTDADAQVQQSLSAESSNVDRVEISDEGRAALANMAVVSTDSPESSEAQSRAQDEAAKLMKSLEQSLSGAKDAKGAPPSEMSQAAEKAQESTTAASAEFSAQTQEIETDEAVIESAESSESSTENLTGLTEQQIKDLVSKGTITQTQANTELSRRKAATQSEESSETAVAQEASTANEEA